MVVPKNSVPAPLLVSDIFPPSAPVPPLVVLIVMSLPRSFVTLTDAGCSVVAVGIVSVLLLGLEATVDVMFTVSRLKKLPLTLPLVDDVSGTVVLPLVDQFVDELRFHALLGLPVVPPVQVSEFVLLLTVNCSLSGTAPAPARTLRDDSVRREPPYKVEVAEPTVGRLLTGMVPAGDVISV